MSHQQKTARVHRFNDKAAIAFETSETFYLDATLAEKLAEKLLALAEDIRAKEFTDSKFKTVTLNQGVKLFRYKVSTTQVSLTITAQSAGDASRIVQNAEGCPVNAIKSIKLLGEV